MMKKNILLLITILIMSFTISVSADESKAQIKVTRESNDQNDESYINEDGERVYTLCANKRDQEGAFVMPKDMVLDLNAEDVDLTDITVEIDKTNVQAKNDLKAEVISSSKNEAKIRVNFSNQYVSTTLNFDAKILVKKDGNVIKEILIAYITPYMRDEHDSGFYTLPSWSGTWAISEDGEEYKTSGKIDIYKEGDILSYTYRSQGKYGVKAFHLDPEGNYTFSNGTYDINASDQKKGGVNTVKIKLKPSYIKELKKELINDLYQYDINTKQCAFHDLMIEYEDGCIIGYVTDFINLGYEATLKIQDQMTLKASVSSSQSIKLRWNKLDQVSGYYLYRYDGKAKKYIKIKTISSKTTSYTDTKLKSGQSYSYKIMPYRAITRTSGDITKYIKGPSSSIAQTITKPAKAKITIKKSGKRLKITIKKVSGASG